MLSNGNSFAASGAALSDGHSYASAEGAFIEAQIFRFLAPVQARG